MSLRDALSYRPWIGDAIRQARAQRAQRAEREAMIEHRKAEIAQRQEQADAEQAQRYQLADEKAVADNRSGAAKMAVYDARSQQAAKDKRMAATDRFRQVLEKAPPEMRQGLVKRMGELVQRGEIEDFDFGLAAPEEKPKGLDAERLAETERHNRAMENRKSDGITVNVGGQGQPGQPANVPLDQAPRNKAMGEVMDADKALAQLGRIDEAVAAIGGAEKLGAVGERAGAVISDVMAKTVGVGPQAQQNLGARNDAVSQISTFRNAIYNKLSGAAVSDSELERMMESVPGPTDSAPVFNAKMKTWRKNLEFEREYGMKALVEGLRNKTGSGNDIAAEIEALKAERARLAGQQP